MSKAADAAGLKVGWHDHPVGLHTAPYMNRYLADYLPRLMRCLSTPRAH